MGTSGQTSVIEFASDASKVSGVCDKIISMAKENSFSDDDIFGIHLSLEEALVNAVKHGNKSDVNKKVRVEYLVDRESLSVSISDEGCGFKPDNVPDPRCGDNVFKLGGRGVLLIKEYMDCVEFNESGNTITMVKFKGAK